MGSPVRAPRSDEIVLALEDEIVTGVLAPGQRVSEAELAARLGSGRAPVREAMRVLESRRLLQRVPYAGMRVVDLGPRDVRELLVLREALEGMAAREAAVRIDREGRRALSEALASERLLVREGVGAVFRRGSRDHGFHETIVRLSGNGWLAQVLLGDLYTLLRTFRFRAAEAGRRLTAAHAEHEAIHDAIRGNRADEAETLMRTHVRRSRESSEPVPSDGSSGTESP